jgi:predicted DNA-binding transcriptional regulator AlpA
MSEMQTSEFAVPRPFDRRAGIALPTDRLWTVHQAAAFLGRSVSWVYKAAERGERLGRAAWAGASVSFPESCMPTRAAMCQPPVR